ncbi:sensor histidine kinase [Halomicroarcula sp. GCM10025710]
MARQAGDGSSDAVTAADGSGSDCRPDSSDRQPLDVLKRRYVAKFALVLLLIVLFVSTAGAVSHVQTYSHLSAEATENLETRTERKAASVAEWRTSLEAHVRDYAAEGAFEADPTAVTQYLREATVTATGSVVELHYVDTSASDPRVVASTNASVTRTGIPRQSDWDTLAGEVTERGTAPSAVAVSGHTYERGGAQVLSFASPVRNGSGVLVLVASVAEQRRLLQVSDRETTVLLNASGAPVFEADAESPVLPVDESNVQAARAGVTTTDERDDDVLAYAPVADTPWVAVSSVEQSVLYHSAIEVRQTIVVLVGTALLSLSLAGVVFGKRAVTPLVDLRNRTEAMERGDLAVDLETDREDEIGRLYDSLDSMRDALREQIREAEDARRAAEQSNRELERQNERLEQFASTVSHDLRNPLTVARGRVELLEAAVESLDEPARSELAEHVEQIDHAHERIDAIIQDVLALAREGSVVEDPSPVSLRAIAEDAWESVDSGAATLTVTGDRTIVADRSRLLRVFENLFRNAIDHVGDDVVLEVGSLDDGFYVTDDGPGIPDEDVDDVFEYGYTTTEDGTGLGLSIVQTIAQAHGWRLFVDRPYEDGAMFVFADVVDEPAESDDPFE